MNCCNELKTIEMLVDAVVNASCENKRSFIVNDIWTDGTRELLRAIKISHYSIA